MSCARILICEDEVIIAEDIRGCLLEHGYTEVDLAPTGTEALQLAELKRPDLVLMDINIGGERNGIEIAQELKDQFQIPVLYVTSYSDTETFNHAKKTEPLGFIIKPFHERALLSTVEIALDCRRRQLALQQEKNEAVKTFASGLAHNINNALTVIQGGLQYLQSEHSLSSTERKLSTLALESCHKTAHIVSDLQWFAEPRPAKRSDIQLKSLLDQAIQAAQRTHRLSCLIRPAHLDFVLRVAPDVMKDAIKNVLINAAEASPQNSVIEIVLGRYFQTNAGRLNARARSGNYVVIEVRDKGRGIDPGQLQHIVEPFFTTKNENNQAGLGLSFTYGVLQAHGGWMEMNSEPGVGTIVRLFLPLEDRQSQHSCSAG